MSTPATEKQIAFLGSLLSRYQDVSGEEAGNTLVRHRLLPRHRRAEFPAEGSEAAGSLYRAVYCAILAEVIPTAEQIAAMDRDTISVWISAAQDGLHKLAGRHFADNRHGILLPNRAAELRDSIGARVVDEWLANNAQ